MKTPFALFTVLAAGLLILPTQAAASELTGVWTKTTSVDSNNVTVFYQEGEEVEAVGVGRVGGKQAAWRASGKVEGDRIRLVYHYSADAVPAGWDPDGEMELTLSEDGNRMSGTAASRSGGWSGPISFKRIRIVQPARP